MAATMASVRGGGQPDATGDGGLTPGDAGCGWIAATALRKGTSHHERPAALEYDRAMPATSLQIRPRGLAAMLGWNRVLVTMGVSAALGMLLSMAYVIPVYIVMGRAVIVGLIAMLVYGLVEQWPTRLPRWAARWVVQLIAMVAVMPLAAFTAYWITEGGDPEISEDADRTSGYFLLLFGGVLFAPWIAVTALVRQRDAFARDQALAFELERSELERQALDARFRLLQAQVEPHFLFNTLANVQALVDTGAPQASQVLKSLIEYLRAAVPRLQEPATTLGQELQLVRSYLELMHMRMPDRLQFALSIDDAAPALQCPPMTLLTLVENAVRHGIDPSEQGGRIDIEARVRDGHCTLRVRDTGIGLAPTGKGLGTGLASLRERLQLAFGDAAELRITEVAPQGVCAELTIPARMAQRNVSSGSQR
jgi:signal transduction histidine kinase